MEQDDSRDGDKCVVDACARGKVEGGSQETPQEGPLERPLLPTHVADHPDAEAEATGASTILANAKSIPGPRSSLGLGRAV